MLPLRVELGSRIKIRKKCLKLEGSFQEEKPQGQSCEDRKYLVLQPGCEEQWQEIMPERHLGP